MDYYPLLSWWNLKDMFMFRCMQVIKKILRVTFGAFCTIILTNSAKKETETNFFVIIAWLLSDLSAPTVNGLLSPLLEVEWFRKFKMIFLLKIWVEKWCMQVINKILRVNFILFYSPLIKDTCEQTSMHDNFNKSS
jgi:hypothetical protein